MGGFTFKGFTLMLFTTFLIWSFNFEACIARRGKHWRQNRGSSASLYKKGKGHGGNNHNYNNGGGSKPKPIPTPKSKPSPPSPFPSIPPPPRDYNGRRIESSTIFNVLDFAAKGDGSSDDTKVNMKASFAFKDVFFCVCSFC